MKRNSSFELLRIIAILFVTLHHVLVFGIGACGYIVNVDYSGSNLYIDDFLNSLCIIGVNVFILISGWYGIKSVKRSLLRLFQFFFIVVLFIILERGSFSIDIINMDLWWFVPHFCILVLLSPIIENSISSISDKTFRKYIVLLTVVNIIWGYLFGYLNRDGYNVLNFIYLYYVARFLKIKYTTKVVVHFSKYGLLYWFLFALFWGVFHTIRAQQGLVYDSMHFWGYNNPVVILSSVSFFLFFSRFIFYNEIINKLASVSFAVYLFTTKEFFQLNIGVWGVRAFLCGSYYFLILYCITIVIISYSFFYIFFSLYRYCKGLFHKFQ